MRMQLRKKAKLGDTRTGTKFLLIPRVIETNGLKHVVWLERVGYTDVYKDEQYWDMDGGMRDRSYWRRTYHTINVKDR